MSKNNKNQKKTLKILCIVLIAIVLFLLAFFFAVRGYFRLPVRDYYKASVKGFKIPGLSDNLIAQGLSYDDKSDCFFVTGYMNDKSASPIYIVDKKSKMTIKKVLLKDENGDVYAGHAGGLSVHGDYVYVAGSKKGTLVVFSYDEIQDALDGDYVTSLGTFKVSDNYSVAYTTATDTQITVGEFYRPGNYETDASHKLTTAAGDYNQAIAVTYNFSDSETAVFGIDPTPVLVYSTTDAVQGMAFNSQKVYLSTSYGPSFSNIYVYDLSKLEASKTFNFNGTEAPLLELDSASLECVKKIAPMSEEIEFVDGLMYTMCESASNKYIFGKFTSAKWCYATKMD